MNSSNCTCPQKSNVTITTTKVLSTDILPQSGTRKLPSLTMLRTLLPGHQNHPVQDYHHTRDALLAVRLMVA